jgi:inositol oxygenase
MKPSVQRFNPYDLYSKNPTRPELEDIKPYYEDLSAKYLPGDWAF